jgi:V8-like Glu-specific endopeptidase
MRVGSVVICDIGSGHTGKIGTVIGKNKTLRNRYVIRLHETGEIIVHSRVRKYKGIMPPSGGNNHAA